MFLTVHLATGALIGQQTKNIFIAFILSFISHFIIDAIPHGDKDVFVNKKKIAKKFVYAFFIDIIISIVLITTLYSKIIFSYPRIIIAGITGSILPDILWVFYKAKNRFLKAFCNFHEKIHHLIKFKLQFSKAVIFQTIISGLILYSIFLSQSSFKLKEEIVEPLLPQKVHAEESLKLEGSP